MLSERLLVMNLPKEASWTDFNFFFIILLKFFVLVPFVISTIVKSCSTTFFSFAGRMETAGTPTTTEGVQGK